MNYEDWLSNLMGEDSTWVAQVFVVVALTLLLAYVLRLILKKLLRKTEATKTLWDDALLGALVKPLNIFVLLIGLSWAADIAGRASKAEIFSAVGTVRDVGIIAVLTWFLVQFISRAEKNLMDPMYTAKPLDETTVRAMGKVLRISVIITSLLIVMQSFGYSISGVLAFGGIGGLAVGFAAKDLLANFFGGLMIYLDRPFAVGDWVRSPDKNIEGTIEDIGWRLTRIRTFDKRPLYVPNATFTQISVENPSRMLNRRIYETIGIRYDDAEKMSAIVSDVKNMLCNHPELDQEQTLIVNFNAFAASSLDFFVYTFTKTTEWIRYHEIKQDVLLKIIDIIAAHGAECAFPTSTLHIPDKVAIESVRADASTENRLGTQSA